MLYVGLDIHWRMSVICILDKNGKQIKSMTIRGPWSQVVEVLMGLKRPFSVCYEASCGYGHIHDRLTPIAARVVVAHPGQLRLIFRSKKKNDRVDAKKLATLLFLDQVPPVHVPSVDVRSWRSMIEFRHQLVAKRTRVKNGLRSLLRGHGIQQPAGWRLWSRKGLTYLAEVEFPNTIDAIQRDMKLDELALLERQIQRVEQALNGIAAKHAGVWLLRTIPGVGPRTAEAMVAYVDDAKRFSNNKKIGSYFGLVPCEDTSVKRRFGHITKEGPGTARRLLAEAAWQGYRRSPHIRAYFERIRKGDPDRKKIALVATAHYLARVMLAMLQSGECWRFDNEQQQAA
jgi:transposase